MRCSHRRLVGRQLTNRNQKGGGDPAALASSIPALRGSRVDPTVALRND